MAPKKQPKSPGKVAPPKSPAKAAAKPPARSGLPRWTYAVGLLVAVAAGLSAGSFYSAPVPATVTASERPKKPPLRAVEEPPRNSPERSAGAAAGPQDYNPQCSSWADLGECEKNIGFMSVNCSHACASRPTAEPVTITVSKKITFGIPKSGGKVGLRLSAI